MYVFLVDDDQDDRELFEEVIKGIDDSIDLLMFKNALELMEYLNREDISLPQIIFLDLNMPLISGTESLKQIRSNPRFMDISIAIYSTSSLEKDIDHVFLLIDKEKDHKKRSQYQLAILWLRHGQEKFFL